MTLNPGYMFPCTQLANCNKQNHTSHLDDPSRICILHTAKYSNSLITAIAGPPDGHLPDPADQDSAATAREAHVRFGESAQGIPEAPARVVS